AGRLHGMTWSMNSGDGNIANLENLAVFSNMCREGWGGGRAINYSCAAFFGKVNMPRYEIGMEMCFEDIFNGSAIFLGSIDIRFSFAQRVDNNSLIARLNVVGTLR